MSMKTILAATSLLTALSLGAVTVDTKGEGEHLDHYWEYGVGAGRVNEGLRSGWQEHLADVKENCGFKYVRMHGLFHDDMFVYFVQPNGSVKYNWQYIDDVYDRMLAMDVRPFVELGFFPKDMALPDSKTQFWWKGNVSVDRTKFGAWHDLVEAFTAHMVERYGLDEVRNWYFEVWNEPNLTGTGAFFHGTKSDYFRLYKEAVTAIKGVDSQLRVGGPATSNFVPDTRHDGEILDHSKSRFFPPDKINQQKWQGVWIKDFLKYCEKEGLPVDFISTHPYPTDYALDPEAGRSKGSIRYLNSLHDDIEWLQQALADSKYPNAEIHLTEWSTSPNSRDRMHDMLPAAAYIIRANLDCRGMANSLMYWTFTDVFEEKGGAENIFHGGFGLINFQGIYKPTYHAYRMLHQLGDCLVHYDGTVAVSRCSDSGKIVALAFNYPVEFESHVPAQADCGSYMQGVSPKHVSLTMTNLAPNTIFELELLDSEHGDVSGAMASMHLDSDPTREEIDALRSISNDTQKVVLASDADGNLTLEQDLQPWACAMIRQI